MVAKSSKNRRSRSEAKANDSDLYLAQLEKAPGRITLRGGQEHKVGVYGEILIVGRPNSDQQLVVEEIRRVSVWTDPVKELQGIASLAGPSSEIKIEAGPAGSLDPFRVRIYYKLLGDLKPSCTESDAAYPQLEILQGRFDWNAEGPIEGNIQKMRVALTLDQLVEKYVGAIEKFSLDPSSVPFRRFVDEKYAAATANSLGTCTSSPPASSPGNTHPQYDLRLRFVNLSVTASNVDLGAVTQKLVDGACQVWWVKGGINIVPEPDIFTPASNPLGTDVPYSQEGIPPTIPGAAVPTAVEVYLVDHLTGDPSNPRGGGGITYGCGTGVAYIILDLGKVRDATDPNNINNTINIYLLAHELGHVLGLTHPASAGGGGCASFPAGSECSVMVPDSPNSSRNTTDNLTLSAFPLGPVFSTRTNAAGQPLQCGWAQPGLPQNPFHIVRDFPYDDGTEPSVPIPPIINWWTQSDVWNYFLPPFPLSPVYPTDRYDNGKIAGALMFNPSHTPIHEEPTYSGPNYMYVRLHTCQSLAQQPQPLVNVYLFLAVPGASSAPLTPLPVVIGNPATTTTPVEFSSPNYLPPPGSPKVRAVEWSVPSGYPSDCCVFAVADSANEPTPAITAIVTNPAAHTFYDLFSRLMSDNDVAQRNLHIQGVAPSPSSGWTTLPWFHMSNPLREPDVAHLEITTVATAKPKTLVLEVNGRVREIELGGTAKVQLTKSLRPGDNMTLRLRAELTPGMRKGASFPIELRFFIGDQLISGYTHILRVAPLTDVVPRVLDTLFGALSNVGTGCENQRALELAERVRLITLDRAHWKRELRNLAPEVSDLGRSVKIVRLQPESGYVRRRLIELRQVLEKSGDTAPTELIEQVRDLADRIQASASHLVRQMKRQ